MANPQLEDGYTRVANEILEAMAKVKLSPTQYRILFIVWRYTYGFSRKSHHLSLSFLAEATGCDRRSLQRDLKRLIDWNILVEYASKKQSRKIGFNKRFSQWTVGETATTLEEGVGKTAIGETTNSNPEGVGEIANGETTNGNSATIGETTNTTVGETTNSRGGETANQERKKKNINKDHDTLMHDEIQESYFNTFGTVMTKHNFDVINSYLQDGLTEWHICEALRRTAENNKQTFRYTMGILNNWLNHRAFTQQDVELLDKAYERRLANEHGQANQHERGRVQDISLSMSTDRGSDKWAHLYDDYDEDAG